MKRIVIVISGVAFLCTQITDKTTAAGVAVAVLFLLYFAWKKPDFLKRRLMRWPVKIFCALTAMGISLWPIDEYAQWLRSITVFQRFADMTGIELALAAQITAVCFAVAGLLFVYKMIRLFFDRFRVFAMDMMCDLTKAERTAMLFISGLMMIAVAVIYTQTDAFASAVVTRDLVYTSDSGAIVHENAYLSITAHENDIRSPLFALFAAPFLGLPYLISCVLPVNNALALVLMAAQIPLLVCSVFLLMRLIPIQNTLSRIALPVMMIVSYSTLLFTVMAEQYIIALFYLSCGLYSLMAWNKRDELLLLGAAGTMIPGAALALYPRRGQTDLKKTLVDALKTAGKATLILCAFGGVSILLRAPETLESISRFTGTDSTLLDRIVQYSAFVSDVFLAPVAEAVDIDGFMEWRLAEVQSINIIGILILVVAFAGYILNRKQTFAKVSMLWIAVSFVLLCMIGWGTSENGLTLYTLYFGWAFIVLLVFLTESVMKAIGFGNVSWIVYAAAAGGMLVFNLPRLQELLTFAYAYYPL